MRFGFIGSLAWIADVLGLRRKPSKAEKAARALPLRERLVPLAASGRTL